MNDDLALEYTYIHGKKIIARRFFLRALLKAHQEIVKAGIYPKDLKSFGFNPAGETTASWRSAILQAQLVARGASKTMYSNHRRGVAVDCVPDREYTEKIKPYMNKHGLVNDLAPWDAVHWQWKSNQESWGYPIINSLPPILNEFTMSDEFENYFIQDVEGGGGFALVIGGQKRVVSSKRLAQAVATVLMRGMTPAPVNKRQWDSIPVGPEF